VSPDGKSMAVMTEDLDTPQKIAIYSLDHSEKPARVLRPRVPGHEKIYNCPNFMPDGKSILFLAATEGLRYYDYDVYRMNLESRAVERLTKKNGYATDLRVFADGKNTRVSQVAFRSSRHAGREYPLFARPPEPERHSDESQWPKLTPSDVSPGKS
jgi:Tol biopolymer transport system component